MPPQGTRAAINDHSGPTTHAFYQDVTIPAGQATLSFFLYYANYNATFVTLNTLDFNSNQQLRVNLIKTTAAIESVAPADILANLYQSRPGDQLKMAPTFVYRLWRVSRPLPLKM